MGDLSGFQGGQIIGAHLAGATVIKTATLLGVSRMTVSKVMSAYTTRGKTNINEEELWAKINTDRKRSSYIEKDYFAKSHNYCSTGERTAELNIHLEDPVSTKTVRREFQKSNNHGRAAIAKPLITERYAQMRKR
jgi:predicted transcriptional regulator